MTDQEREMDLALAECEAESRLLRARIERLEKELTEALKTIQQLKEEDQEEDNLCPVCKNGSLYTKPHWNHWQCDLCGQRQKQDKHET